MNVNIIANAKLMRHDTSVTVQKPCGARTGRKAHDEG